MTFGVAETRAGRDRVIEPFRATCLPCMGAERHFTGGSGTLNTTSVELCKPHPSTPATGGLRTRMDTVRRPACSDLAEPYHLSSSLWRGENETLREERIKLTSSISRMAGRCRVGMEPPLR